MGRKPKDVGALISALRDEQELSRYALAQRAGVSDQTVGGIESGKSQPSLDTARRLMAALGKSLAYLDEQLPPVELEPTKAGRPRGRPRASE
jgi:transcriptional regulator with XRE-family HTH domain